MCQCTALITDQNGLNLLINQETQFTTCLPHIIAFQFCLYVKVCLGIFHAPSYILAGCVRTETVSEKIHRER